MKIIDANYEIENITKWIKNYFIQNGHADTKAVIGISGGKDSTVAAALLCKALGPDRVVTVMMPCGEQADIEDSYRVIRELQIPSINIWKIDIKSAVDTCIKAVGGQGYSAITTNTPARVRMIMLYQVAAMVGGRVCNTSNASEAYIGYCTKYGDLAGDFSLLSDYYVRDVITLGLALGLPRDLVEKIPADGMCGSTDEDRLGFSYAELDAYLIDAIDPEYIKMRTMKEMYKRNTHKSIIHLPRPTVKSRHNDYEAWDATKMKEYWF